MLITLRDIRCRVSGIRPTEAVYAKVCIGYMQVIGNSIDDRADIKLSSFERTDKDKTDQLTPL